MTSMLYIAYFKILISREVNVWPVKLFWTSYPGLVLLRFGGGCWCCSLT